MKRSSIVVLSIILSVLAVSANAQKKSELWEIHPVFRLEFCPKGKVCAEGDWIDINK